MDREKLRKIAAKRRNASSGAAPSCRDVESTDPMAAPAAASAAAGSSGSSESRGFNVGSDVAGPSSSGAAARRGAQARATINDIGVQFPILHRRDFADLDQDMRNRILRGLNARTAKEKKEREMSIWMWRCARGRECILNGDLHRWVLISTDLRSFPFCASRFARHDTHSRFDRSIVPSFDRSPGPIMTTK